jgi:hypothetical protein
MIVTKTEHHLTLIVWHHTGTQTGAFTFETNEPSAPVHIGDGIRLDLEGFAESRLMVERVREVHHTFTGGRLLKRHTIIHVDQDREGT